MWVYDVETRGCWTKKSYGGQEQGLNISFKWKITEIIVHQFLKTTRLADCCNRDVMMAPDLLGIFFELSSDATERK